MKPLNQQIKMLNTNYKMFITSMPVTQRMRGDTKKLKSILLRLESLQRQLICMNIQGISQAPYKLQNNMSLHQSKASKYLRLNFSQKRKIQPKQNQLLYKQKNLNQPLKCMQIWITFQKLSKLLKVMPHTSSANYRISI